MIYLYEFENGDMIEIQQKMTDSPLTEFKHPATKKIQKVKKVFTVPNIVFKGNGWTPKFHN